MKSTGPKRKFINLMDMELEDPDQLQIYELKVRTLKWQSSNQLTSEHLSKMIGSQQHMTMAELDPEGKQNRIHRIMEHTKEEIDTQWVRLGSDMKDKYDKLKIEFVEYKIANDISRFFEDIRSVKNPMKYLEVRSGVLQRVIFCIWIG